MAKREIHDSNVMGEFGDEQHWQWWEQAKKHLAKPESVDIDDLLNSPPYSLLAWRSVQHLYASIDRARGSLAAARLMMSLGFQMRASIQDLMAELQDQGRDYDLLLQGGFAGEKGRWKLFLNEELFAVIDRDFGFDCFDISGTQFKCKIAELIDQAEQKSKIHPLSEQERKDLDARIALEPNEWGRLHPDERHPIGLGKEFLNSASCKSKEETSSMLKSVELNKPIISKLFKSQKIKQHLLREEIDAWTQALLVYTADASVESKRHIFKKLIKEEERLILHYETQIDELASVEECPQEEYLGLQQKRQDCDEARHVFISYLEFIDDALHQFFPALLQSHAENPDAEMLESEESCILCTFYKHDDYYELDGTLGLGAEFEKRGFLKIVSEMAQVDTTQLFNGPVQPTLRVSSGDRTTFTQIKSWDKYRPIPQLEYDEPDDEETDTDFEFYLDTEDGSIKSADGRDFTEVFEEYVQESKCDDSDDHVAEGSIDNASLVGYTGKHSELSFILDDHLGNFVFGPNDEHLTSLQSLFVGIFKQGDILTLDFEPFYKKREGVVLKPAYKGTDNDENYAVSEMVLTKVGTRWACGTLAGRFFFGGIDPLGFYLNSYSAVKESGKHQKSHDMVALEALIGTFLDWAQNGYGEGEDEVFASREDAAEEAEFYMLEAVQLKLIDDPTLADRIIRAFDWSPQFGLTDQELLELCGLEV